MRKKIHIGAAALLAVLIAVIALQPAEFRIVRSATIRAPAEDVFAQVNDFHAWDAWSPWARLDPESKATFAGAESGVGAIFTWSGNSEVGEGTMTLTESHPFDRIRIKIEFVRPMTDTNDVEFTFQPHGDQTVVTWSMSGRKKFLNKTVCLFMDVDKMVGGQFEQGLASIKSIVEQASDDSDN